MKTRIPQSVLQITEHWEQEIYFNDYIETLQQWEAELIRGTQQVLEIEDVISILQDEQKIYLVSDGGEENGLGYFGWVIASETEILVKHKGHAAGNPSLVESLRTKSVGVLSIISYILRLYEFYEIRLPKHKMVQYCDNITAANRRRSSQRWNVLYPNTTLKADYDVQSQIDKTIRQIKRNQHTEWESLHVKGHQTGPNLKIEAELNNIADELATAAREELPWNKRFKNPPLYPASKVAVTIDNKMITRKIEKEIIQAVTAGEIRHTMENKYNGAQKPLSW